MISSAFKNTLKKMWLIPIAVTLPVIFGIYLQRREIDFSIFIFILLTSTIAVLLIGIPAEYVKIKKLMQKKA